MRHRTVMPGRITAIGPIRVAIYLRVSTAKQLKGYGLEVQLDECIACLDFKLGKGKYTYEVYTDGAVSGKLANRPDLDTMNREIAAKMYDLVIFGKLDRIGRTMKNIHRWMYDTTDLGLRVVTADGRIDSEDEMFGIQLSLLAYMAEIEHAMILDRTLGGREKKLEKGGWPAGVAPYGLKLEGKGEKAKPVRCEEEIKVLEHACHLIVDLKKNTAEAARELNALEMYTRSGKPWDVGNLRQRLRSTSLDGYVVYRNMKRTGGTATKRDEEGNPLYGETKQIPVPRVLPEERVAAVRKALSRSSFTPNEEEQYLLSKRVFGVCGKHYIGHQHENPGSSAYRCSGKNHLNGTKPKCSCKEINARELERAVWSEVEKLLVNKAKLRELADEWLGTIPSRIASYRSRLAELDETIAKKKKSRKTKVMALLAMVDEDGDFDEETIEELKKELKNQEDQLQKLRDDTHGWLLEAEQQEAHVMEILELVGNVKPELDAFTFEQRMDLLELLDIRVELKGEIPGRRVRSAKCPFEAWLAEEDRMVPSTLTDEQWERIQGILPKPKSSRGVDARLVFEGSLYKVRNGVAWPQLPADEYGRWHTIYQRALIWFKEGYWTKALEVLGEYEGTPVPALHQLPSMKVTGSFDLRLTKENLNTSDDSPVQASRWAMTPSPSSTPDSGSSPTRTRCRS